MIGRRQLLFFLSGVAGPLPESFFSDFFVGITFSPVDFVVCREGVPLGSPIALFLRVPPGEETDAFRLRDLVVALIRPAELRIAFR